MAKINLARKEMIFIIMNNIASWFRGNFNENNIYNVTGYLDNKNRKCIVLIPKNEEFRKYIKTFTLCINKKMKCVDYIIISESSDDFTKINFKKDVINNNISQKIFDGSGSSPSVIEEW